MYFIIWLKHHRWIKSKNQWWSGLVWNPSLQALIIVPVPLASDTANTLKIVSNYFCWLPDLSCQSSDPFIIFMYCDSAVQLFKHVLIQLFYHKVFILTSNLTHIYNFLLYTNKVRVSVVCFLLIVPNMKICDLTHFLSMVLIPYRLPTI